MDYKGNEQEQAQATEFLNDLKKLKKEQLKEEKRLNKLKQENAANVEKLVTKNQITASEARALADEGDVLLGRIYKCIKEAARESETKFGYCAGNISNAALEKVTAALRKNGFTVSVHDQVDEEADYVSHEIRIAW